MPIKKKSKKTQKMTVKKKKVTVRKKKVTAKKDRIRRRTPKKLIIKMYGSDTRDLFIKKIHWLKKKNMGYKDIVVVLNNLGFRNRKNLEINRQFISNLLHRHVK